MAEFQREKGTSYQLTVTGSLDDNGAVLAVDGGSREDDPHIPAVEELEPSSLQESTKLLRRFHLGEPRARASTTAPDATYVPILLNGFRSLRRFRYEYPLLLLPEDSGELLAKSLDVFLREAMPEGDGAARILKDNVAWLETYMRDQISGQDFATLARDLLIDAGRALQEQIGLNETNRDVLQADLDILTESIPTGTHVLPYGRNVALYLLQHTIRHRTQWQREQLKRRVEKAIGSLQQLVDIEADKKGSGSITGEGSRYFDESSMVDTLEHRSQGSIAMSATRLRRVEATLAALSEFELDDNILHLVVRPGDVALADASSIDIVEADEPCIKALEIYDACAERLSAVYAGLRIAELEMAGAYDESFHDSWFESFDAEAFNDAERETVATVVAFESAERITEDGMQSFSTVLGSGKPVQILINTDPHTNPGHRVDLLGGLRLELAYLGIGHRHAVINQISAARYEDLLSGFAAVLAGHQGCLHLIHTGFHESQPLHPWIMAGAATESRAHPHIRFDPVITAAPRDLTFAGNPCPEQDWSTNVVSYTDEHDNPVETELAFTFADYCLLRPELHDEFRIIPDGCNPEDLASVADYLEADVERQDRMIPFIWAVDGNGSMRKLVTTRRLIAACRDRLDFWHSLQSQAGVKNVYVEEAIRTVREEEQQRAMAVQDELVREHEDLLQQVRSDAADDVMSRLAAVLMDLDLSADSPHIPTQTPSGKAVAADVVSAENETVEVAEEIVEEEVEQEEDEVSFNEPWIDSIFCTTCDDCLALNNRMFVYNDDRQAIISDPALGTYAQLVEAAEICPARCIHPGKPLDPNESDLDDLTKRAEPFN